MNNDGNRQRRQAVKKLWVQEIHRPNLIKFVYTKTIDHIKNIICFKILYFRFSCIPDVATFAGSG